MDGWMDRWMDGQIDNQIDRPARTETCFQIDRQKGGYVDRQTNQMDGKKETDSTDRYTDGGRHVDRQIGR